MTNTTATRSGQTLTITYPNGETRTQRGKRAAAAVAVSTGRWNCDGVWTDGVHGSFAAAQKHARTYSAPMHPGGAYWLDAEVVPVTEEAQA